MSDDVLISHQGEEREPRLPRVRVPRLRVRRLHLAVLVVALAVAGSGVAVATTQSWDAHKTFPHSGHLTQAALLIPADAPDTSAATFSANAFTFDRVCTALRISLEDAVGLAEGNIGDVAGVETTLNGAYGQINEALTPDARGAVDLVRAIPALLADCTKPHSGTARTQNPLTVRTIDTSHYPSLAVVLEMSGASIHAPHAIYGDLMLAPMGRGLVVVELLGPRASNQKMRDAVLTKALRRAKRTLAADKTDAARTTEAATATKLRGEVADALPGFLREPDIRPDALDDGAIAQRGVLGRIVEIFADGNRLAAVSVTSFTTAARAQQLLADSCAIPDRSFTDSTITTKPITVASPAGAVGCTATFDADQTEGSVTFVRGTTLYRILAEDGTADPTALVLEVTKAEVAHLDAKKP